MPVSEEKTSPSPAPLYSIVLASVSDKIIAKVHHQQIQQRNFLERIDDRLSLSKNLAKLSSILSNKATVAPQEESLEEESLLDNNDLLTQILSKVKSQPRELPWGQAYDFSQIATENLPVHATATRTPIVALDNRCKVEYFDFKLAENANQYNQFPNHRWVFLALPTLNQPHQQGHPIKESVSVYGFETAAEAMQYAISASNKPTCNKFYKV